MNIFNPFFKSRNDYRIDTQSIQVNKIYNDTNEFTILDTDNRYINICERLSFETSDLVNLRNGDLSILYTLLTLINNSVSISSVCLTKIMRSIALQTIIYTYNKDNLFIDYDLTLHYVNNNTIELHTIDFTHKNISIIDGGCVTNDGLKYIKRNEILRLIELSYTNYLTGDISSIKNLPTTYNGCIKLPLVILNDILYSINKQNLTDNDIILLDNLKNLINSK